MVKLADISKYIRNFVQMNEMWIVPCLDSLLSDIRTKKAFSAAYGM